DLEGNVIATADFEPGSIVKQWQELGVGFFVDVAEDLSNCGTSEEVIISFRNNDLTEIGNDWYVDNISVSKEQDAEMCPVCVIPDQDFVNLEDALGDIPSGLEVQWYDNAQRTGTPLTVGDGEGETRHITQPGTYYAFYWDEANDCFNVVGESTAAVTV